MGRAAFLIEQGVNPFGNFPDQRNVELSLRGVSVE